MKITGGSLELYHTGDVLRWKEVLIMLLTELLHTARHLWDVFKAKRLYPKCELYFIYNTLECVLIGELIVMKLHRLNGLILDDPSLYGEQSGYLCFVKDERNPNYCRGYVGQASKPRVRIQQHFNAYTDKKTDTHYSISFCLKTDIFDRFLSLSFGEYP